MYYTQEQIDRANQADLVSFLQSQGEQLTRAGNEYRWKRHDSLTIWGNKWYRHRQSKGGGPVDFVMEFYGKSFTEVVELLTGEKGAAPPPDSPAPLSDFRLPPRSPTAEQVKRYLTEARRIDEDVWEHGRGSVRVLYLSGGYYSMYMPIKFLLPWRRQLQNVHLSPPMRRQFRLD